MYESLNLTEGKVKDFIQKYKMKMTGSSLETAVGWIDGIGELSPKDKAKVLKGIKSDISDSDNKAEIIKNNPWAKGILSEKTVKIVTTGKAEFKKYQLMVPDGSELIDMEFTSPAEAKKYAKKKGFKLTEGGTLDEAMSADDLRKQVESILNGTIKSLKKLFGKTKSKDAGQMLQSTTDAVITQFDEWSKRFFSEGSTENAKKSLDAIVGHLEKRKASGADVLGATGRSMLKMGQGIAASYKEEGGFSPDQAKWIWKTSVALFKK